MGWRLIDLQKTRKRRNSVNVVEFANIIKSFADTVHLNFWKRLPKISEATDGEKKMKPE